MSNKLARNEFITGVVTEELTENLPTVKVTKALAKQILAGTADSVEVRVTKDFAQGALEAVETAYARVLAGNQSVGIAGVGTLKAIVKKERPYNNPQGGATIVKPAHLSAKLALSKGFKETLENTTI